MGRLNACLLAAAISAALGVGLWMALPGLIERWIVAALEDQDDWEVEIDGIALNLWRREATLHGLHARGLGSRKVLKAVEVPHARFTWRWMPLLRGVLEVDAVARGPAVTIGTKVGPKVPKPPPPLPEPKWPLFTVDILVEDGVFRFVDAHPRPDARVELTPVQGTIQGLGTVPGPARFTLDAEAPGGGHVRFDALMDFWNAHLDAFDMRFLVDDLDLTGLPDAALGYLGTTFLSGRMDATFALVLDKGRRELPPDGPFYAGRIDDLEAGRFVAVVHARDLVPTDPPLSELTVDRLVATVHGVPNGDHPVVIAARVDGVDATVTRSWIQEVNGGGRRLPAFHLTGLQVTDLSLTLVDDTQRPSPRITLPLQLSALHLHNLPGRPPGTFTGRGVLARAPLRIDGALRLDDPDGTRVRVDAHLDDLVLPRLETLIRPYVDLALEAGVADLSLRYDDLDGTPQVTWGAVARGAQVAAEGWRGRANHLVLDGGRERGHADVLIIEPEPGGILHSIIADGAQVTWSNAALLNGRIHADIQAAAPTVVLQIPTAPDPPEDENGRLSLEWTLNIHTDNGTLIWRDLETTPETELRISHIRGKILGLGTEHPQSLWTLDGVPPGGGRVRLQAVMDPVGPDTPVPWRVVARVWDASLPELQRVTGYVDLPRFTTGRADGVLSVEWIPDELDAPAPFARLALEARGLTLEDLPTEPVLVDWVSAVARWDPDAAEGPVLLSGRASGLDVRVGASLFESTNSEGPPLKQMLTELGPFHLTRFDIDDARITWVSDAEPAPVEIVATDVRVVVQDLSNLGHRAGVALQGQVRGGRLAANLDVAPLADEADLRLVGSAARVPAVRLNDALRAWANLDVDQGTVDLYGYVRAAHGELDGTIHAVLDDVDVLQCDDIQDGLGHFLRSVAVGLLLDLVDVDDVARASFPVEGTLAAPRIQVVKGLVRAALENLGLRRPDADEPLPVEEDEALPVEVAPPPELLTTPGRPRPP